VNVISYGAPARVPTLPRLKATILAVPISGNRIALRRGTNPTEDVIIEQAGGTSAGLVLGLLDGTHDVPALAAAARTAGAQVDDADITKLIVDLRASGVLDDAATPVADQLDDDQAQRYSRNLNCWSATIDDGRSADQIQRQLLGAHALIVGVGGLGSAIAHSLAMAGCGTLTLVDFDEVELQNLNRQSMYDTHDLGKPKVDVAAEHIRRINPDVTTVGYRTRVTGTEQVTALLRDIGADVVVGGADRPAVAIDRWLTDASLNVGVPYVAGALSGAMGRVWTKMPGGACFTCDQLWSRDRAPQLYEVASYREEHDLLPATSALSFGVQIVAGLMGYDILHHLLGLPVATAGRIVAVDFATLAMTTSDRPRHPECDCR
jgi:molybdopterin/thiamine biosynthesis adenylyltransferase